MIVQGTIHLQVTTRKKEQTTAKQEPHKSSLVWNVNGRNQNIAVGIHKKPLDTIEA